MHNVAVRASKVNNNTLNFEVRAGDYDYKVSCDESYYHKLTSGKIAPEELVRKSFEFLLERESPNQILSQFNLSNIQQYFPEFEEHIKTALS